MVEEDHDLSVESTFAGPATIKRKDQLDQGPPPVHPPGGGGGGLDVEAKTVIATGLALTIVGVVLTTIGVVSLIRDDSAQQAER